MQPNLSISIRRYVKILRLEINFSIELTEKFSFKFISSSFATQYTATATPPVGPKGEKKVVSKAMKAYLERAREHDEFMKIKDEDFRIGKRHLANMMGEDPETFTQDDIDVSVDILLLGSNF